MSRNTKNKNVRSNSNFVFSIDGQFDGSYVRKVSGGNVKREIVKHAMGPSQIVPKGLGGKRKYQPITFECSVAMGRNLMEWINQAFRADPTYHDGVIFEADQTLRVVRETKFYRALISEVTIPAFDADGKEHAYLTVKIQPEWCEYVEYGSPQDIMPVKEGASKARNFPAAYFTLDIDGMGDMYNQVTKLDSFTWKANLKEDATSEDPVPGWVQCGFDIPEFKVQFNAGLNQYFDNWAQTFIIQGIADEASHKTATLTFRNLQEQALSSLTFNRMGLASSPDGAYEAGSQGLSRKSCDLYASDMKFDLAAGSFDS